MDVEKATLVQQYELLLVAQHRFLLADVMERLYAITHVLQHAEVRFLQVLDKHKMSDPKLQIALESMLTPLRELVTHLPVFLGDTELDVFVRALQEFTRDLSVDQLWTLKLTVQAQELAETLAKDLVSALESEHEALTHAITSALPVMTSLRKKREHLMQLVDASLAIVDRAELTRTRHLEDKQTQLLTSFKEAVKEPSLQAVKWLDHALKKIESSITTMLQPHAEICRPISVANAQVASNAGFNEEECVQIHAFVNIAFQLLNSSEDFTSMLHDPIQLVQQIKLFENAASKDAFVVLSSALKLNFHDTLDDELFLAYTADWQEKTEKRQEMLVSSQYAEASKRVIQLKEEILRVQALIHSSRNQPALGEGSKAKLAAQIAEVFQEAGGDTNQLVQIIK